MCYLLFVLARIKEANFYGASAQCVMSGSDDGYLHVWEAKTGKVLSRLLADDFIVNCCIQAPGGFDGGLVATSGLDVTGAYFRCVVFLASSTLRGLNETPGTNLVLLSNSTVKLWYPQGESRSVDSEFNFTRDCEEQFAKNLSSSFAQVSDGFTPTTL